VKASICGILIFESAHRRARGYVYPVISLFSRNLHAFSDVVYVDMRLLHVHSELTWGILLRDTEFAVVLVIR
jgi:hypothetical protein